MAGGGKRARLGRGAEPEVAAWRAAAAAVVAALALLFQLVAIPYHQALAASAAVDVASVAAGLKVAFGGAAALCVQSGDKGAPLAPAGDCGDHCPLCRFAAQVAMLVAPDIPALPLRFDAARRTLGAAPEAGAVPACPSHRRRARAPPFAV